MKLKCWEESSGGELGIRSIWRWQVVGGENSLRDVFYSFDRNWSGEMRYLSLF